MLRVLGGLEAAMARRRLRRNPGDGRPYPDLPPGTATLPQVEHIVVLMMENHSYDNYLGMLTGRGDGLALRGDGEPVATNPAGDGTAVPLRHAASTVQKPDVPTQSWHGSHIQWNGGACDGFVRSTEQVLPGLDPTAGMCYWTERDLPFYYGLARTFPLATRWFSSCLGPTFPNRRFLIAGTAHGLIDDWAFGMVDYPASGTIFDRLGAHGISWANYHHVTPLIRRRHLLRASAPARLRLLLPMLAQAAPRLLPAVESKLQVTADLFPLDLLRSVTHLRRIERFFGDAAAGALPAVSIVDPDFRCLSEENPQDIQLGEGFAAAVIDAVMRGPGWPTTLLIWLYDEHGGYYDHVPPPAAPPPDDVPGRSPLQRYPLVRLALGRTAFGKRIDAFDTGPHRYDRLGFRVPAVIVSPYARPDYVTDRVYDHTSVLKLIERVWNLPPLTRRDAAAVDPLDAVDFDSPPRFLNAPRLPEPARPWNPAGPPASVRRRRPRPG